MTSHPVRVVNVVPSLRIKKEKVEIAQDLVACRVCKKGFANDLALRNHVRMEHVAMFAVGNPEAWTDVIVPTRESEKRAEQQNLIKMKTEQLISSMTPTRITSLASEDVSYIIIKQEKIDEDEPSTPKRRKSERPDRVKVDKPVVLKKDKEAQPITGPFECLQPSTLVAEGTCHQIFFSCCEYSAHFRDEHTRRRKGLRCQVCEKPLSSEHASPFSCDVCGIGFNSSKELSEHTAASHVKLKPFECTICHKRFTQQGGVLQHMRMHTGDRPFPCTFCPKAFTQKSGLDQHLRIHTRIKPYRCVICGKSFCQSVHLKQHMRTHTNVSPFQCGICQKRFKQSSHLNYHLRYHNPSTMTEEERRRYAELIGGRHEIVEVAVDQTGMFIDQSDIEEQVLAEQSIQVEEESYILTEPGKQWTFANVQLVEDVIVKTERSECEEF